MTDVKTAQYATLILRLSLGIMFLAHAGLKFFTFTLTGTAGFFESLGLPGFLAYVIFVIEIAAGILLVAGLYTRWAATATIPILAGSIIFVHGSAGWLFSNPGGGWEYPAFLISASVAQVLLGDGAFALRNTIKGSITVGDINVTKAILSSMVPFK
jgi:putative oxidoreductase